MIQNFVVIVIVFRGPQLMNIANVSSLQLQIRLQQLLASSSPSQSIDDVLAAPYARAAIAIARPSVCMSVCLSVKRWYCVN